MKEIEREINLELTKVNKDDLRIHVSFTNGKDLNVDWIDGSMLLESRTVARLINQPTHVIAYYIRNTVLSINGWNTVVKGEIETVDPITKPYVKDEYGDGWWFNDRELDCPDINLRTSEYRKRVEIYNDRLRAELPVEIGMDWEWHIEREAYYPRVHVNWSGSGFNLILFDLDHSYQLLRGEKIDYYYCCLYTAIKSLLLTKS